MKKIIITFALAGVIAMLSFSYIVLIADAATQPEAFGPNNTITLAASS